MLILTSVMIIDVIFALRFASVMSFCKLTHESTISFRRGVFLKKEECVVERLVWFAPVDHVIPSVVSFRCPLLACLRFPLSPPLCWRMPSTRMTVVPHARERHVTAVCECDLECCWSLGGSVSEAALDPAHGGLLCL